MGQEIGPFPPGTVRRISIDGAAERGLTYRDISTSLTENCQFQTFRKARSTTFVRDKPESAGETPSAKLSASSRPIPAAGWSEVRVRAPNAGPERRRGPAENRRAQGSQTARGSSGGRVPLRPRRAAPAHRSGKKGLTGLVQRRASDKRNYPKRLRRSDVEIAVSVPHVFKSLVERKSGYHFTFQAPYQVVRSPPAPDRGAPLI